MQPGGPGWNDPPKLNYQVHAETKTRRNLLNKRVAYLGNETKCSVTPPSSGCLDPSLPPPISTSVATKAENTRSSFQKTEAPNFFNPNPTTPSPSATVLSDNVKADDVEELEWDEEFNFMLHLKALVEHVKEGAKSDVLKRVEVLGKLFETGQLSDDVTRQMRMLVFNLCNKRFQKAWDIHVALTCDHFSEVGQWMPGIKHLMNALRNNG